MAEHLPECPVWRCCKPDERATMHMCICPYDERIVGLITRQRAEQIGRNIGQCGCVITEQQHLPECPVIALLIKGNTVAAGSCICARLRACEERVLDAAREAIEVLLKEWWEKPDDLKELKSMVELNRAIIAIDALREGDQP